MALELTQLNHLKFGYGPDFLEFSPREQFYIKFGTLSRRPELPFIEAQKCARYISDTKKNLRLCMSGGLDSEIAAISFLCQGIPFEARILKFMDGWNSDDMQHAVSFCMRNSIPYKIIELDIIKFFENGDFSPLAELYRTQSPELAAHCWFLDQVDGTPILGGEIFRYEIVEDEYCFMIANDQDFCFFRYFKINNKDGVPNFHYFSSEFAWSFSGCLNPNPEVYDVALHDRSLEFYQEKLRRYEQGGFPLQKNTTRVSKLHGFEKIKNHYDQKIGHPNGYIERFRKPLELNFFNTKNKSILIPEEDFIAQDLMGPLLPKFKS